MKEKLQIKLIFYLIIIILSVCVLFVFLAFKNYINDEQDFCLDTGFCKEGTILNINKEQIEINKESCTKNNGVWSEKDKICIFK